MGFERSSGPSKSTNKDSVSSPSIFAGVISPCDKDPFSTSPTPSWPPRYVMFSSGLVALIKFEAASSASATCVDIFREEISGLELSYCVLHARIRVNLVLHCYSEGVKGLAYSQHTFKDHETKHFQGVPAQLLGSITQSIIFSINSSHFPLWAASPAKSQEAVGATKQRLHVTRKSGHGNSYPPLPLPIRPSRAAKPEKIWNKYEWCGP